MLSKWVVATYQTLVELALWVFLLFGGLVGAGIGKTMDHPVVGLIIGAVGAFLGMAVFLGAALLLSEIHKSLTEIQKKLNADTGHSKALNQLGTLERQTDTGKNKCPTCGEYNLLDAKKCEHCGRSFATNNQVQLILCPNCFEEIPVTSTNCPKCQCTLSMGFGLGSS